MYCSSTCQEGHFWQSSPATVISMLVSTKHAVDHVFVVLAAHPCKTLPSQEFPPWIIIVQLLFFSSSKSFHLEGKRNSPFADVHCIETSWPTKAEHKNYQETMLVVHMCQYNHICIFECIGHVLEVKRMYYGCIGKVSFRITSQII